MLDGLSGNDNRFPGTKKLTDKIAPRKQNIKLEDGMDDELKPKPLHGRT